MEKVHILKSFHMLVYILQLHNKQLVYEWNLLYLILLQKDKHQRLQHKQIRH